MQFIFLGRGYFSYPNMQDCFYLRLIEIAGRGRVAKIAPSQKTARAPFCSLALLADFLQVAVDAGLRDAQRGGGAGHGALEHEHPVAVEVANDVHAVALAK